jgi:hypothetical protein
MLSQDHFSNFATAFWFIFPAQIAILCLGIEPNFQLPCRGVLTNRLPEVAAILLKRYSRTPVETRVWTPLPLRRYGRHP